MKIQFKTKNPKQLQASSFWLDQETEQLLYGGAKAGGKSFLGASLIFGDALIYPETHYFIARQELIDLRKFTIPTINEVFKTWGLDMAQYAHFNGQDSCYTLYNGSKVFLISCKDIPSDPFFERFGSMQMTRGWIEEGGEVAEAAKANLWLSIGRWKNDVYKLKKKLLITCNPKKGWMKQEFIDPWKRGELLAEKQFIPALSTDNPYLSKDYIKTLSTEKNKVRRQRLFEGKWDYDEDENSLISFDALCDAFTNTINKDNNKYLIADIARLGKDSTVFSLWQGLELYKVVRFQKQATNVTEQQLRDLAASERIPYSNILIDEDGIGGGVVDHLLGVKGFVANSSPIPNGTEIRLRGIGYHRLPYELIPRPNFSNLKTQCAFKLAELINEHQVAFKTPEEREVIIEELSALLKQKDPDKDGKRQLVPKEDVKQEIGKSPDLGDTLIMRMLFELRKNASNEDPEKEKEIREKIHEQMMRNASRQNMDSTK